MVILTCMCLVPQLCPTLCNPIAIAHQAPLSRQFTGVGCHALLQGISPTQGSNPGLSHCRQILYQLSHHGSPLTYVWIDRYTHMSKGKPFEKKAILLLLVGVREWKIPTKETRDFWKNYEILGRKLKDL